MLLARFALAGLLAAGCATPAPSPAEIAAADIGPAPAQEAAEEAAMELIVSQLVDPASAQIDFGPLERGYYVDGRSRNVFAWRVVAVVNSRNRMGGYAGAQAWPFWFRHGATVAVGYPSEYGPSPNALELDPPVPLAPAQ